MTHFAKVLLGTVLFTLSAAANAQVVVHGMNDAGICYRKSLIGDQGSRSAIETCTDALSQNLTQKNHAATLVNRGILYMRKGDQDLASKDFQAALEMKPEMIEVHINYGASLIRQDRMQDAVKSLNIALEDKEHKKRPEALYNRAIAFDALENYRGAYRDLKEALILRPDWEEAEKLFARYEVRPAG